MNKLREIRKRLGVSKWRLSKESGLNWKTINRAETKEKMVFEATKEKIAKALGMSVEEIFPSGDVHHIFITEPRTMWLEKKKSRATSADIVGYLLDRKLRRVCGVTVNLMVGRRMKLAASMSEADGRFEFRNVPLGEYVISAHKVRLDVSV